WPALEEPIASIRVVGAAAEKATTNQRVRALVAEVLLSKPSELADDATLVDLGMDSVTAVSLISKIEGAFGVRLNTNELLLLGTIARITRRLEGATDERAAEAVRIPLRTVPDPQVDLVMFPGAGGTALMLAPWATEKLIDDADISAMHP